MKSFPFKSIVLPAVLVSCAVFSVLTLPLTVFKPQPIVVDLPPVYEGEIHFNFSGRNKTFVIRYIGFALVVSVGSGIATVEAVRRWQLSKQPRRSVHASLPAASGYDVEWDATPDFRHAERVDLSTIDLSTAPGLEDFPEAEFAAVGPSAFDSVSGELLQVSNAYPTYRIKTPEQEHSFFAILFDGEFYRLFRVRKSREKALEVADRLQARGDRVVITEVEQGYAVWVLQPDAYAEMVS